jgi:hypothetical protein
MTDKKVLQQALDALEGLFGVPAQYTGTGGGAKAAMPTPFQAGYQTACEEILHRLRTEVWAHCLHNTGEPLIECGPHFKTHNARLSGP